jgi:two-component system phosphate regulon sensor histidine kinase PhoR
VRLLTETLARDLEDAVVSDRVRDRVAKIDIETGHLVQMVNELLDLSRIEGGAQLYVDVVDCGDVIRGSVDRLRLFADRQSVQLVTVVPADLPLVNGDAERLGQVLVNLLHNAVKFSPAGGTVTVRASGVDGEVDVAVEDQGPGIARSDQPRIFERFYKVDRARSRGTGGTGLGLAIARHVVEGHGGRIWVESEPGAGATFHIRLPVREPVPAPAGESARP